MPPTYQQANRPMTVTTPLGPDVLLLVGFSGHEAISQLFSFELDLAAEDQTKVVFEKLLGRKVTVNLTVPGGQKRHFSGICTSLTQGMRGIDHTSFKLEVSPHLWLLTRRSRSRIFQNVSVPEILKSVLDIPDVVYELEGTFHSRTYCVQYRETDFHFASRLMEEEGIYYYFKHKADAHQMVVSNKAAFPELQPTELIFQQAEGTHVHEERITRWQKQQQLRSVKVTLRDHHFQMPQKSLEAVQEIQDDVKVGKVTHKLRIGDSDGLEVYDWPGAYSHRFDAIDRGGADRPDELQKLLQDNERTAKIRMEQEAAEAIAIQGSSRYRHLASGHTFTLKEQVVVPYDGSASHDGKYVLTSVNHTGRMSGSYRSGDVQELHYDNSFTGIPAALHFRPQRITPRPVVTGTQTAVVVGPKGEQIHTDKHGRVKVQFHWDREGKHDAASSCWIRVAQAWADKGFGAICLPRAGQEVVVAFDEGDPDRPLILGSVYNADNPPPFKLPEGRMFSGIKTNSVNGTPAKNFSGLAFNDSPDGEHAALYSEKDMTVNAENNHVHFVGNYQHAQVGRMSLTTVGGIPGLGGGGSGGGSGDPSPPPQATDATGVQGTTPSFMNWKTSSGKLAATPGFSGGTVYGVNSQDTVGWMHQITIGQATQIAFDPFASWGFLIKLWAGTEVSALSPTAAYPVGGNQQLYWGTNYQSTYGPNVNYTYAPQLDLTAPPDLTTKVLATLVPTLCIAYELVYACADSDSRAEIAAAAFLVIGVSAVACLISSQELMKTEKVAGRLLKSETENALVSASLAMAVSPLLPDLALKKVQEAAATAQASSPDLPLTQIDNAHNVTMVDGVMLQVAEHIHLIAAKDPTSVLPGMTPDPTPSTVYINAAGYGDGDGVVFIHATKGLTLTSGGASLELLANELADSAVTLKCGPVGKLVLTAVGPEAPKIELTATSITLQASPLVSMTLDALEGITLNAGPINEISMDLAGNVDIETLNFTLDAKIQAAIDALIKKVTTTLTNWAASLFNQE